MGEPLKVIIVEDVEDDAILIARELQRGGFEPAWERVQTAEEMEAALARGAWDVVIADYALPRFDAQVALSCLQRSGHDIPFIVVSGTIGEETAVEMMKAGAHDYFLKGHMTRLPEAVRREMREARDRAERRQAEQALREQTGRLQQIMATVPEGVLLLDASGRVVLANPVAERDLALLADAQVGDVLTHLGDRPLAELLTTPPTKGLWHEVKADGRIFEVIARPTDKGLEPESWVLVVSDVTRQREVQRLLQQQERLATVGQLAAGIAHDFNNILATVMLYAQMMAQSESMSERDRERATIIHQQGQLAARLIQQVLDFSRRAVLERRPLDLLTLLKEQVKLLERTLPEHIKVTLSYERGEHTVNADPTRMQQAIMNLAVNARDAMPEGGELKIHLERVCIERREDVPLPEMSPGEWIRLTVADTGTGIPQDVLPHLFEPFFTTKEPGKGSGLGLAQVHGIIAQHDGAIDLETKVGRGTTFFIYLPALPVAAAETAVPDLSIVPQGHGETVLVVEDELAVREALVDGLEQLNYEVLQAANGAEALATVAERGGEVALVVSDMVMPVMGGITLLRNLRQRGWNMPVILLTGHPVEERKIEELRAQGLSTWLPKPPSIDQLARAIADALAG